MKILGLIALILLVAGCRPTLNLSSGPNQIISLTYPPQGATFTDPSASMISLQGKCKAGQRFLITSPQRGEINCVNSNWSYPLDLDQASEGPFTLTIEEFPSGISKSYQYTKRFVPPHVTTFTKERDVSVIQDLYHSERTEAQNYLVYSSDEFCAKSECFARNIAIRFRSEDYNKIYHVTSAKTIDAIQPLAFTKADGNIRIFYLTADTPAAVKNLYYLDFNLATKLSGPAQKITSETINGISSYQMAYVDETTQHLFYLSREYCRLNVCSVDKISWRSSDDNYASVDFLGDHTQCGLSSLKSAVHRPTGTMNLAYALINGGTCVAGNNKENLRYNAGSWTRTTFNFIHFGGSKMIVDNSGEAFLFYRSFNGWEGGFGCSNWDLRFRRSSQNFATANYAAAGCSLGVGYPGDEHAPGLALDDSGNIILSSGLAVPNFSLALSSSANGFSTRTTHQANTFAKSFFYQQLLQTDTGTDVFYVQTDLPKALMRLKINGAFEEARKLVSIGHPVTPVELGNGEIGFIGVSDQYCQENGCTNDNYYLQREAPQNTRTWLTKLNVPNLSLYNPQIIPVAANNFKFIYSSNEDSPNALNIFTRDSADGYLSKTAVTSATTGTNTATAAALDGNGVIHLVGQGGTTGDVIYRNSSTAFAPSADLSPGSLGSSLIQLATTPDGDVGIIYGGNESGPWRANIRWSIDSFATRIHALSEGSAAYRNRTIIWSPAQDLELYFVGDQNTDGRWQVTRRTSLDSFATFSEPFSLTTQSVCQTLSNPIVVKYDSTGRLFIMYSAKTDGSNACQLYVRSSDDWSRAWNLTAQYPNQSYDPAGIFLQGTSLPKVCARNSFSLYCYDLSKISRQ